MIILDVSSGEKVFGSSYPILAAIIYIIVFIAMIFVLFSLLNLYPMRSEMRRIRIALEKIAKNTSSKKLMTDKDVFDDEDDEEIEYNDVFDDDDDDDDYQPVLIKGRKQASFSDNSALAKLIEEHEVRYRYAKDESERAAIRTTLESLKKALESDK